MRTTPGLQTMRAEKSNHKRSLLYVTGSELIILHLSNGLTVNTLYLANRALHTTTYMFSFLQCEATVIHSLKTSI